MGELLESRYLEFKGLKNISSLWKLLGVQNLQSNIGTKKAYLEHLLTTKIWEGGEQKHGAIIQFPCCYKDFASFANTAYILYSKRMRSEIGRW